MPSEILCTNCEKIQECIENVQRAIRDMKTCDRLLGPPIIIMTCQRLGQLDKKTIDYLMEMAEKDTTEKSEHIHSLTFFWGERFCICSRI